MRLLSILFLTLIAAQLNGQGIPDIDWTRAGLKETYDLDVKTIDFSDVKLSFSADVTDDVVMDQILRSNENGAIIYFPKGEYHFTKQIKLSSGFVLKGEGEASVLIFDLDKEQDCILAEGKLKEELQLDAEIGKGQSQFICKQKDKIVPGKYLYLIGNDIDLTTSFWAESRTGQFIKVKKITDQGFQIFGETRRAYRADSQPQVRNVELVKWVGIEQLKIVNNTKTDGQSSNIRFRLAENCWVGGVTSEKANYAHVLLEYAVNCEVMGSNFSKAHDYGNGGKGYGVTLQFATSECLILGNHFDSLRHAMLLQAGANGNVLARNTSENPYWTDVRLPKDAAGDIVLHGNYVYANLIEENECQTIVVDNSHGRNGPDNFFYKNTVNGYGIRVHRKSRGQAFVYNVIVKSKWPKGRYKVRGKHFEKHNTVRGKIKNEARETECFKKSYWY